MASRAHIFLILPLLAVFIFTLTDAFNCHRSRQYHYYKETPDEYQVKNITSKISAFELTVQRPDRLVVACTNSSEWSDFLFDPPIDVGVARTLVFTTCAPPGAEYSQKVVDLLGVSGVEQLKYAVLNGSLTREDLKVYPNLKKLLLSDNDLSNVTADLLKGE